MSLVDLNAGSFDLKKRIMKLNVAIKYGAISGGLIVSTWFVGQSFTSENPDFSNGELVGYAIMIVALSAAFLGVKSIRDEKGSLSFKEGFLNGLGISLVASLIYVIGWMIYMPNFAPDFADKYGAAQIAQIEKMEIEESVKQEQIEEVKYWIETYKKPPVMAAITFSEIFPVGLLVTLISALILKRKKK